MTTRVQALAQRSEQLLPGAPAYDSRFRRLVGREGWQGLCPAIRLRFAKRLQGTAVALYAGEIVETRLSLAGWLLSQACRLIGAPLPLHRDSGVPAVVVVSEDRASGGQRWTRIYHRSRHAPQVINSAKTFAGMTGLEELIGGGIGMALTVQAAGDRLVFCSDHYFLKLGSHHLRIPAMFSPGKTVVTHRDLGGGEFAFDLDVVHPWLGELIHQHAIFRDQ